MSVDRYLVNDSGARVDSRAVAALISFSPLLAVPVLAVICAGLFAADLVGAGVAGFLVLVLALVGGVIFAWVVLFRVHAHLKAAVEAWKAGDLATARQKAQQGLRLAFRGDFRTKGFHVLALVAEGEGDFEASLALFDRARQAIPTMAAPIRKKKASSLIEVHRALALIVLGRAAEAGPCLEVANEAFQAKQGIGDALLDDGGFGMGPLSINGILKDMEGGRQISRFGLLVRALLMRAYGDARGALELIHSQRAAIEPGLLARERVLLDALERDLSARLQSAFRGAASPGTGSPHEVWAARVLGV